MRNCDGDNIKIIVEIYHLVDTNHSSGVGFQQNYAHNMPQNGFIFYI